MVTINSNHLNDLKSYLETINTSFAQTNQIIYAMIGGTGQNEVEVSEVSMETTETAELQIAALIEDISENLVWLTNTANSLFSIDLITLGSAEPEEEGTVGAPPQDPGGEKDE
jgi:hypothetical protein